MPKIPSFIKKTVAVCPPLANILYKIYSHRTYQPVVPQVISYLGHKFHVKESPSCSGALLNGMPEPEAVDFLKTKVRGTVFDIGANYGWYSLIFSGWANVVYSFEPIPSTYKELTDNIALNESKNIIALNSALGNRNEDVEFFCPDVARGSAIASEHNYFGKKVKVCMTTLDDFMKKYSISGVDFIKIDVEGGELNMLKGAEKTLRSFHPDLFLEIESRHAERFGYKSADIFNYLASLGYESREQVENMVYFKSIQ